MVIKALLFFMFALALLPALAQAPEKSPDQDSLLTIQRLEITNPSIKNHLQKFIQKASAENELFAKGFAYITLLETRAYYGTPVNKNQKNSHNIILSGGQTGQASKEDLARLNDTVQTELD